MLKIVWLTGPAGSGKTVLSRAVENHFGGDVESWKDFQLSVDTNIMFIGPWYRRFKTNRIAALKHPGLDTFSVRYKYPENTKQLARLLVQHAFNDGTHVFAEGTWGSFPWRHALPSFFKSSLVSSFVCYYRRIPDQALLKFTASRDGRVYRKSKRTGKVYRNEQVLNYWKDLWFMQQKHLVKLQKKGLAVEIKELWGPTHAALRTLIQELTT